MLEPLKTVIRKPILSYFSHRFSTGALQMLFIYGHMRSGSSLLVHILNSNPAIIGYGETHSSYHNKSDFSETAYNMYRKFKTLPSGENYILDKVLHPYLIKNHDLLFETKVIFILRHPLQSIPSIHNLNKEKYTPSVAFNYYIDRIESIRYLCKILKPHNWTFTTYNHLINDQTVCFNRIEQLLKLQKPINGKYDTIWSTGKRGIGDGSDKIHRGKIFKNNKKEEIPDVLKPYIKKAENAYLNCIEELNAN